MKFGIVIFPGTWSDRDCYHAITEVLHQPAGFVWHQDTDLSGYGCIVLPGGFSYGDYLRPGAIARFSPVMSAVERFAAEGGLVLGICNGFQILCEAGFLPGALLRNQHLQYRCQWAHLLTERNDTPFTSRCGPAQVLRVPVSHGEGNYYADPATLAISAPGESSAPSDNKASVSRLGSTRRKTARATSAPASMPRALARIMPMPMISGGTPATPNPRKRSSGVSPFFSAVSRSITITPAAPSESGDALPAVTVPLPLKTGRSFASPSRVVSARRCSSTSKVISRRFWLPFSPALTSSKTTGTISSLNFPASVAATARWCYLLFTSDAADERSSGGLGGRRYL